jgi:hypothetical protein
MLNDKTLEEIWRTASGVNNGEHRMTFWERMFAHAVARAQERAAYEDAAKVADDEADRAERYGILLPHEPGWPVAKEQALRIAQRIRIRSLASEKAQESETKSEPSDVPEYLRATAQDQDLKPPRHDWPYTRTFNAIAAAIEWRENKQIGVSVEKFAASFGPFSRGGGGGQSFPVTYTVPVTYGAAVQQECATGGGQPEEPWRRVLVTAGMLKDIIDSSAISSMPLDSWLSIQIERSARAKAGET